MQPAGDKQVNTEGQTLFPIKSLKIPHALSSLRNSILPLQ